MPPVRPCRPEQGFAHVTSSAVPPCHVLVVDDEPLLVRLMTRALEEAGFVVHAFDSGTRALAALLSEEEEFDVVVSDIRMPGVDGHRIAAAARAQANRPAVLLVTGFQEPELLLEMPYTARMNKPFNPGELVATVRRIVAARPCDSTGAVRRIS